MESNCVPFTYLFITYSVLYFVTSIIFPYLTFLVGDCVPQVCRIDLFYFE